MFVSVKFRAGDTRTYTYQTDTTFSPGDRVLVEVKGEQKIVHVAEIDLPAPKFECKPIIGVATCKEDDADGVEL